MILSSRIIYLLLLLLPRRKSDPGWATKQALSLFSPLPATVHALIFFHEKAAALSSLVDSHRICAYAYQGVSTAQLVVVINFIRAYFLPTDAPMRRRPLGGRLRGAHVPYARHDNRLLRHWNSFVGVEEGGYGGVSAQPPAGSLLALRTPGCAFIVFCFVPGMELSQTYGMVSTDLSS